jgi:hypothetical protein
MKKLILGAMAAFLIFSGTFTALPAQAVTAHEMGTNVVDSKGTIWFLGGGDQSAGYSRSRSPYTSAGAFVSYPFNKWSEVVPANSADMALAYVEKWSPPGENQPQYPNFIAPQAGEVLCSDRGTDKGTCYLIAYDGAGPAKFGFTSEQVFFGLGYSFSRVLVGDLSWMRSGGVLNDPNQDHPIGVPFNYQGTIMMRNSADGGVSAFTSMNILQSCGYLLSDIVPASQGDIEIASNLSLWGQVIKRAPGELSCY